MRLGKQNPRACSGSIKRLFLFFLFPLALVAQTPISAPAGVKSTTGVASQAVTVAAGQTVLIGDTWCDNTCTISSAADTLTVTGSQGDTCTQLATGGQANESGQWWQCTPATAGSDTVTATVTSTAAVTHNAIQLSVWGSLPNAIEMAVGGNVTPSAGWTALNAYNGSSVTAYGGQNPSFSASPTGGIVSYVWNPAIITSLFFSAQIFSCTVCTVASQSTGDWSALSSASIYEGATITLYQVQNGASSLICSATLNAQAQASCSNSAGVNVAPAFLNLTYQIAGPAGTVFVPAGAFTFTAPAASLTSSPSGTVTVWLGFDSKSSAPRFGWIGTS